MKTLTEDEFLKWAAIKGLGLDPQYPQSAVLTFQSESERRFWIVPPEPEARPAFLALLIDLLGDWRSCYVWRHLGGWPHPDHIDAREINDAVEMLILRGLGLPPGGTDVVQIDRSERASLVALLFSTTVFGWSVREDLYVVPDNARQIVDVGHHGAVHVSFADPGDVNTWTAKMSEGGFPLPIEPPDATFKRPSWMVGSDD